MPYSRLCRFSGPQSESQRKRKRRQVLELCKRTKKAVEYESEGDAKCNWGTWNDSQSLGKGIERVENREINRDHPNYSIVEIS